MYITAVYTPRAYQHEVHRPDARSRSLGQCSAMAFPNLVSRFTNSPQIPKFEKKNVEIYMSWAYRSIGIVAIRANAELIRTRLGILQGTQTARRKGNVRPEARSSGPLRNMRGTSPGGREATGGNRQYRGRPQSRASSRETCEVSNKPTQERDR